MISKKEVQHIAKLARLGLSPKEIEKMRKELSPILDYFEKLKKVDVSEIKPEIHSVEIENVFRDDESQQSKVLDSARRRTPRRVASQKLLEMAPEKKDGYLKVKSVF